MSRSASYTPRLLAVSRLRGFRGLVPGVWARISAVVRSGDSGSDEASAVRWEGRREGSCPSDFFLLMLAVYPHRATEDALDAHQPAGYVSELPQRPRARQYNRGA